MNPLNYMRLHNPSSGNQRQHWTIESDGKIRALTILAQKLARAVYYMLKRKVAFDTETFFQR
jgi:hypothetical protein